MKIVGVQQACPALALVEDRNGDTRADARGFEFIVAPPGVVDG